jgi:hypothetical protein
MEKLVCMIAKNINDNLWKPVHFLEEFREFLFFFFFAYDILIFSKAKNYEVRLINALASDFCKT